MSEDAAVPQVVSSSDLLTRLYLLAILRVHANDEEKLKKVSATLGVGLRGSWFLDVNCVSLVMFRTK